MKSRLGVKEAAQDRFVMIDSTHIPTLSEKLHVNAMGYNPQHSYDPQVRLMYIFSAQMKQPVYYRLINGNITDVTSMKICVDELNAKDVVFIADKGFYSKKNVVDLINSTVHFIIPLHRNNSLIDYRPLQKANFKKRIKNYFTYQKRVIWYYEYEKEGQLLTTYLDERLRVEEEADFLLRTKTHPDKYKEADFFEKIDRLGTLTLISHLPEKQSAQLLYETYKLRNEIEVMFDAYKHFLEADKTYMQDRYVLEGWLMANFIAMIAYYRLYKLLKKANKLSKYAPKDIVEISKSIYQTKIRDTWVTSEITKKMKDLFKMINIDYLT
jgi:transposase